MTGRGFDSRISDANSLDYGLRNRSAELTAAAYPKLLTMNAQAIRVFLTKYNDYVHEITARHAQRASTGDVDGVPANPISLKFCVDSELILAAIGMGMLKTDDGKTIDEYDDLTDHQLRSFLEEKSKTSKDTLSMAALNILVKKTLRMDMRELDATTRMQALFMCYYTILGRMASMDHQGPAEDCCPACAFQDSPI
eukprot:IDg3092t1